VIGRLYFEGASRVWVEASEQQRSHDAIGRLYRVYQKQHQQQQNRLEAALQRHWLELTGYLDLDSVTLEDLLLSFGSAKAVRRIGGFRRKRYGGTQQGIFRPTFLPYARSLSLIRRRISSLDMPPSAR